MDKIEQYLREVLGDHVADAPFLKALEQKKVFIAETKGSTTDLVRKEILKNFVRSGQAPSVATIAETLNLTPEIVHDAIKELGQFDLLVVGVDGEPLSAYPFSDAPTNHEVAIQDGSNAFALCAIDALGVASMLNQSVNVNSTCHHCGRSLQVSVNASGDVVQAPPGILVWLSTRQGCDCTATTNCPLINFFCEDECIKVWLSANSDEPGFVLGLDQAATGGKLFFGDFLR